MQYREPEWLPSDRDAVVALLERRRNTAGHGYSYEEATSSEGDPSNPERTVRWHVPNPTRDFAQQALDQAKKAYTDRYGDLVDPNSLLWRLEKRSF